MRRLSALLALSLIASVLAMGGVASANGSGFIHCVHSAFRADCDDVHATIQDAIDHAAPDDDIRIEDGTYAENLTISTPDLEIRGQSSTGTILAPAGGTNAITIATGGDMLNLQTLKIDAAAVHHGVYVNSAVDNVAMRNFRVLNASQRGFYFDTNAVAHNWNLSQMFLTNNPTAMRVRGEVYNLKIRDGSRLNDNVFGITAFTSTGDPAVIDGLDVSDTQFNNNTDKGLYFEVLKNAVFDRVQVVNSGTRSDYIAGAGFDINVKYADYQNITIKNSTISNNGHSAADFGGGLTIKGRDDGSYSSPAATLDGVTLLNNDITGNAPVGVQFGEPGKDNVGPTNVHVNNNNISGNQAGLLDQRASGNGPLDASANWWGSNTGPSGAYSGSGDSVGSAHDGVDFTPWLDSGTDTNLAAGFQGDYSKLHVDDDSPQSQATGRIQEGVDDVSGSEVRVKNGTYSEHIVVDKPNVKILGESWVNTVIDATGGNGVTYGPMGDGGRLSGLRVVGGTNGVYTDSEVDDIVIRNIGSLDNTSYGIEIHNSAVVHNWDISQTTLRGNKIGLRVRGEAYDTVLRDANRFNENDYGFYSVGSSADPSVIDGLNASDTEFNGNTYRGMYLEALNDATFTGVEVMDTASGDGVDLNLKYATYGGVSFVDSVISGNGGRGLNIKGRNDGSYAAMPATLTDVTVTGNDIEDNDTQGLEFGNNVQSAEVHQNNLTGNTNAGLLDYTDDGSTIAADCNWWGAADGPSGQGSGSGDAVASTNDNVDWTPWLTMMAPSACDETPPELTVPDDITVLAESPSGTVVNYSATATDDTDPSPTVDCDPPSGSTFPIGTTTVDCTATDNAGNSSSDSFDVTVVDQKDAKQGVRDDLAAEYPTGDEETDKRLEKAIKALDKSLEAKYWGADDLHLDEKEGKHVFDEERKAVKELQKIESPSDTVTESIDWLVAIDRSLAQIAINDMAGGDAKKLDKANEELFKGDAEAAAGDYDKAIEHYKKAWEHAQKA